MTNLRTFCCTSLALVLLAGSLPAFAQQDSPDALPDSPGSTSTSGQTVAAPPPSHRFNGIISTSGIVEEGSTQPRQSIHDKFVLASEDTFTVYGVAAAAVGASLQYQNTSTPEFGKGGPGYARYYWHTYADRAVEIYSVEFLAPVLFHQDSRFYYLGKGGFGPRLGHAMKRTFVTRSDSGHAQLNLSELVGAGAASGLSSLYYPSRERTAGNVLQTWGINLVVDTGSFIVQEFYPDLARKLFHH